MKFRLQQISIVLLTVFTLSLVSELTSSHFNPAKPSQISTNTAPQNNADSHNSCDDVCQSGLCHFGHCSHVTFSVISLDLMTRVLVSFHRNESFHLPLSCTDQPARPPRLS